MGTDSTQGIQDRLTALHAAGAVVVTAVPPTVFNAATAPLGVEEEEDDDYEPDLTPAEDTEQILNKLDNAPPEVPIEQGPDPGATLALGPFKLPSPHPLDPDTAAKFSQVAASRVFSPLASLKDSALRKPRAGINRLAASSYDRDSWLTLITRLATRSTAGLEDHVSIKPDDGADAMALDRPRNTNNMALGNVVREMLYGYVLEDWRRRIEVAVAWLCEEWYNDQLTKRSGSSDAALHYEKCALRLVDGFLSYITAQDKVLTRFLAEIPELSRALLGRLKVLCADPTTVQLALTSLLYLVMMRPPVREIALDTVADIWVECEFPPFLFHPMIGVPLYPS
jgi:symplekin